MTLLFRLRQRGQQVRGGPGGRVRPRGRGRGRGQAAGKVASKLLVHLYMYIFLCLDAANANE